MCGIWALINKTNINNVTKYFNDFMKIKHRGPDFSNFLDYNNILIGFHRLSIMDPTFNSNQPYILTENNKTIIFICNGEIYNYRELIFDYNLDITSKSDCLTIPKLYLKLGYDNFIKLFDDKIKGEFAFILFEFIDNKYNNVIVGRDQIGIRPLYYHPPNESEQLIFSSEIKGCSNFNGSVIEFSPGTIQKFDYELLDRYDFKTVYNTLQVNLEQDELLENIKSSIIKSINRRLDSDQEIAFLLSGGVDSSLVVSIASKLLNKKVKTYCCGMNYGSDLQYAKIVADYIGSEHTEVIFTPEEGLNAINDIIYTTETWDTTTIRASVGQYLVSKYISQNTKTKVLFVGEGPDEVCSSYLFNWYATNSKDIHSTAIEYVNNIHYYDVKRCDRCISRWGMEARVALLDPEFIKSYWLIPSEWRDPKYKGIEKWWLRQAFSHDDILPEQVLWRKKEAFSDGISSKEKSWFQIIQEHILTNFNMKEEEYYKQKFIEYFGESRLNIIPNYWQPKWNKDGVLVTNYVDPSARTLDIYS